MSKGFQTVDLLNFHGCASGTIATPAIGQNGNWYVGNDDTGVKAGTTSDLDQRIADLEAKYEQLNSDYDYINLNDIDSNIWGTVAKVGKTIIVTAVVNRSVATRANIVLLPMGYRPITDILFRGAVTTSVAVTAPYIVKASGYIQSNSDVANTGWTINACYSI